MRFEQMSQDMLNHLLPGQRALQDALSGNDATASAETETVTSGTLSATIPVSYLSVTGTQTYTLPNGVIKGQRKVIYCTVAASIPAGTLTITTPNATSGLVLSSTFFFDTVGQGLVLIWDGAAWNGERVMRAGGTANNVVVGTTVLTGKNLWKNYMLSVSGTQASTAGGKQLPDGNAPGDTMLVTVTNAASIPSGTIGISGTVPGSGTVKLGQTGVLGTIVNTSPTNYATLVWDGTLGWQLVGNAVLTIT